MKNCLIFGSGRSGTSMIGGILHDAGYFMGNNLYPPRHSNPKGFFENAEINGINEIILSQYDRPKVPFYRKYFTKNTAYCPAHWQRWLISLQTDVNVTNDNKKVSKRIKAAVKHKPFAYKDPRFSYTLPVWKPYLDKDTVFICVFREPNVTVNSILKECALEKILRSLEISEQTAYESWLNIYSHVVEKHLHDTANLVFVHFNQIYDGSALPLLSERLDTELGHHFVDRRLKRTTSNSPVAASIQDIYRRLCDLADYSNAGPQV